MPSRCWIPMAKAESTRTSECGHKRLRISTEGRQAPQPTPGSRRWTACLKTLGPSAKPVLPTPRLGHPVSQLVTSTCTITGSLTPF